MPVPPVFELIDWKETFWRASKYEEWLNKFELSENKEKIKENRKNLFFEPYIKSFLKGIEKPVYIIVIAEDWCGDVIRHVPIIQSMSELSENLNVRYLKRDEGRNIFPRFLTNGGEAIPKFIFISEKFVECGNWGPMSQKCREIIARGKSCGNLSDARKKVSAIYRSDPECQEEIRELLKLIDIASCSMP